MYVKYNIQIISTTQYTKYHIQILQRKRSFVSATSIYQAFLYKQLQTHIVFPYSITQRTITFCKSLSIARSLQASLRGQHFFKDKK